MGNETNLTHYISFSSEVNQQTTEVLLGTFGKLVNSGVRDIVLMLSTLGGGAANGLTIYNTLRGLPISLTTHNVGTVNSIGNVIYLAGDKRYACKSSSFMFHGVGFSINQPARFEEKDLREKLDSLNNDQGLIADIINERTDINAEEANDLFLRTAFLKSDEACQKGIVHKIRAAEVPKGSPFYQLVFKR